ncbi:MAG TPA: outer membrane beta-barrel protein [Gemmatimonadota bacterium]|nr:outer membrane beta-barrel protein [Gemmatimonadota bacterium]
MVLRRAVGIALASIAWIGVSRELQAQPITVTNNGQAVAGAQVSAMINGIKQPLGVTNSTGRVTIDTSALNITKGTEVTVWIKTCEDGKVQVIMVPPGQKGECTQQGAQAGEECGCDRLPVAIIWGDGPVTIDIGTKELTQTRTGETAVTSAQDHSFADLQIGGMFDYSSFYQWEDVACNQTGISSCEADGGAPGLGVYLDYQFGNSPLGISLEAHYAQLDVSQSFQSGSGPSTNDIDVNSWFFQATGVYSIDLTPRAGWYGRLGGAIAHDILKLTSTFPTGRQSDERTETGSRLVAGTGFHFPVARNWCVRTGIDLTTGFDSGDADTNARYSLALGYRWNRN